MSVYPVASAQTDVLMGTSVEYCALARLAEEPGNLAADVDERLAALDEQLRASLADTGDEDPRALATRLELMYDVGELREQLRERHLFERLDVLARMQDSLAELRACETPEALIEATPRELCRSCGFSRALISRVNGSRWIPEAIETLPDVDPEAQEFVANIDEVEIPLGHLLPETELVRRRMPALVSDPVADPLGLSGVAIRGGTAPYVAAPIMPTGRVIGFLHADRLGQDRPVTVADRDNLWTFAEQFGFLYERAVLLERLNAQREQLRHAFVDAEGVLDALWHREIDLARCREEPRDVVRGVTALLRPTESRLDGLMTRREREVLELMSSGATNTRIAGQLVISEGTVKSHVKHILRKLRATNRAEAVARYLQILLREQEERGDR